MHLPLNPGTWKIDSAHSTMEFIVRHLGLSNVRGRFQRFDAQLEVHDSLARSSVTVDVELASVDTNQPDRDNHLRSTDFFGVDKNPRMSFRSTGIAAGTGEDYLLTGDLTINGVTKPVTLDVQFTGTEVYPFTKKTHAGFSARGELKRSDFGIKFNVPLGMEKVAIGEKVKIELELQFIEP
jgi:polyisoprenoid-binding protein YceI